MMRITTVLTVFTLLMPAAYAQQVGGTQGEEGPYAVFFDLDSASQPSQFG